MNMPLFSSAVLACSLLSPPTAHAIGVDSETTSYEGLGFTQDLNIDGLFPGQVEQIEVGTFASYRDYPDLALRLADGRVFVNPDTFAYGGYQQVSEGFEITSMTAIQGAQDAQLLMTDGTSLMRLQWASLTENGSDRSLNPVVLPGVSLSSAEILSGERAVLLLSQEGQRLLCLEDQQGNLTLKSDVIATTTQGRFYDARLVNFSSDPTRPDQLAVITNQGLEILEQDGSPALFQGLPFAMVGFPAGASLAVLPAELAGSNRDHLLWKFTVPTIGDIIAVLNIDHTEVIFATGLGLEEIIVTTWQREGSGEGDLVLPIAAADQIWLSNNTGATEVEDKVFEINFEGVNQIDLGLLDGDGSNSGNAGIPALVRSYDMNLDGAGDLVVLDSNNHLCVLPGTSSTAISERAFGVFHVVESTSNMDIHLPGGLVAGLNYSVWWQASLDEELVGSPMHSGELVPEVAGQVTEFLGIPINYFPNGTYTIVLEPFDGNGDALPPTVLLWATDPNRTQEMIGVTNGAHPWVFPLVDPNAPSSQPQEGPNGTVPVPRPRVNPLPCPEGGC